MRVRCVRPILAALLVSAICAPTPAFAQETAKPPSTRAIGEEYHIELSGGMWGPTVFGIISSEQFGIAGTEISFVDDLGFKKKQFADVRLVLRPGKKHKFRFQYTPVSYSAESTLSRNIVFNGILYPVNVPVNSTFDWTVIRFGYEYDIIYRDRGYFGILIEGRYTEMQASLKSPLNDEFTRARAPLPSLGAVLRLYPLKNLSVTAEVSGLRLPDIDEKYEANYADIDIYGTFNVTHNFGAQVGWRRMHTFLRVETDRGDIRFAGLWFGGAIRF